MRAPSVPESPLARVASDLARTPSPSVHTRGCRHGSPPPPEPFSAPPPFRSRAPAPAWVARCAAATSVTVFPLTACCGGWTVARPCPFPLRATPLRTVLARNWGGAHGTGQGTGGVRGWGDSIPLALLTQDEGGRRGGGCEPEGEGGTGAALLMPREGEHVWGTGSRGEGIPSPLHPLRDRKSTRLNSSHVD